jgi:hypothetical protein
MEKAGNSDHSHSEGYAGGRALDHSISVDTQVSLDIMIISIEVTQIANAFVLPHC